MLWAPPRTAYLQPVLSGERDCGADVGRAQASRDHRRTGVESAFHTRRALSYSASVGSITGPLMAARRVSIAASTVTVTTGLLSSPKHREGNQQKMGDRWTGDGDGMESRFSRRRVLPMSVLPAGSLRQNSIWTPQHLDALYNPAVCTTRVFLASTVPFALAAAFFPAGLATVIWLLSALPPALRRGLAYLSGAAVTTVASGAIIVALMRGVGGSAEHPGVLGGFEIGMGVVLMGLAVWFAVRKPTLHDPPTGAMGDGRLLLGEGGIFLLGMAMWTPSFAYLAALEQIADAELGVAAVAVNLLVVDVVVLSSGRNPPCHLCLLA